PLRVRYREHDVFVTALPSHGAIVAEALGLLDGLDLSAGPLAATTLHQQIEAVRLAFADRLAYLGDPRFVAAPVDRLLSASFLAARRRALDLNRAGAAHPGVLDEQSSTTAFVVADSDGMAVSFIHSLSAIGGSGLVAGDSGILLNNRVGRGFTLEEGHPNELAGGKRTMHTLNCYQIHRDGDLVFLGATPGGDGQPQWNVQIICDLLDFGMSAQQAVEWPRWAFTPGTDPITRATPLRLEVDGRYPPAIVATLRAMGHPARSVAPWEPGLYTSGVQLIERRNGVYFAGSDPRAGGLALAR
ncbi:MAG: gamma-glutamyltransferase, partial [Dehalococcoidia bacterium]|nr:gamma-glutamyltransferase [Dehalococcoidia bacterium]